MTTHDVAATLAKLPPACFADVPGTGIVRIVRGQSGYEPVISAHTAVTLNARLSLPPTPAQVEAMIAGSMFGWHVPAADPDIVQTGVAQP